MELLENSDRLIAKTFEGLEGVLAGELENLGAGNIRIIKRGVSFTGDKKMMYKANYLCRSALRVIKPIAEFSISNQDDFYEKVLGIPWEKFLTLQKTFAIDPVVFSGIFTHSHFAALRCKDAIADRFLKKHKRRPSVDTNDTDILINLHIKEQQVTISLDSSGSSLHLRGYRKRSAEAPLNEVLAAGMIMLTGWKGDVDLYDPFCGSGTLLIEGAMQAMNIPAGHYRENYGFMNWTDYDGKLWNDIKQDAEGKKKSPGCRFFGSDISGTALSASRVNIRTAGLSREIDLKKKDVRDTSKSGPEGIIITNPPYGERMKTDNISGLYSELGDTLKNNYLGFSAWVLTSDMDALKNVGLRTSKKLILFNGPLECRFANFELYKGSRKPDKN